MKTFFAFTTGLLVGAVGIAAGFFASKDVQRGWNTLAQTIDR